MICPGYGWSSGDGDWSSIPRSCWPVEMKHYFENYSSYVFSPPFSEAKPAASSVYSFEATRPAEVVNLEVETGRKPEVILVLNGPEAATGPGLAALPL